jgi:hypothetical protein
MSSLLNLKEAKQLFYGGNELDRVYLNGELIWDRPSEAMWRLWSETQGLAIDFTDGFYYNSTARFGTVAIKDTTTPANNLDSVPDDKLSYPGASVKYTRDMDGVIRYRPHNLYVNSATPANQSITVVSGATYAVKVTGSVSVTASGAATGTWTAGTQTFTAATGTLTLGSTSGSGAVYVRRTPSLDVDVVTGAAAKITLPYEWGPTNLFASPSSPATQTITGLTVGRKYTVYVEGSGAIALSGAGNGTATASAPRTFKASATSLVCTVSGSLTVVHVREALGIRQESARTNLLRWSENLTVSPWNFTGVTRTQTATGPDGVANSATRVIEDTATSEHRVSQLITAVSGSVYTWSAYVRPNGRQWVAMDIYDGAASRFTYFNLSGDGSIGTNAAGNTSSIRREANGWYRLEVTRVTAGTSVFFILNTVTANNGALSFAGDGASGVDVWCAQIELGGHASSPIETFGSTVTRAEDAPYILTSQFPYASEGTAYAKFRKFSTAELTRVFNIDGNFGGARVVDLHASSGIVVYNGSNNLNGPAISPNVSYKVAVSYRSGDYRLTVGGALADTRADALLNTPGRIWFGLFSPGVHNLNGYLEEFSYVPRFQTDAERNALTAA